MARFVEGMDRGQASLLPGECLRIGRRENPVRAVDVFVGRSIWSSWFDGAQPNGDGAARLQNLGLLKSNISAISTRAVPAALESEAGAIRGLCG